MNRIGSRSTKQPFAAWLRSAPLPVLVFASLCLFGWAGPATAKDAGTCNCAVEVPSQTASGETETHTYSDCAYSQTDCRQVCESALGGLPGITSSDQVKDEFCETCSMSCARLEGSPATFGGQEATKGQVTQPFKQYSLQNPLAAQSVPDLIGRVARILMGLVGTFALLMFVYGSFLWLTSQGNTEQVQKGKQVFTWAVIGLIVVFSAYIVLRQVFSTIGASD